MSVIFETQKAIYSKLTTDTALMGMITGVYDHVPQNSEFPYATIGNIDLVDNSAKGLKGYQLNVDLDVYSNAQGRKECLDIIERLKTLLDDQSLSINGFVHIFSKVDSIITKLSVDNSSINGLVVMKVFVKESS